MLRLPLAIAIILLIAFGGAMASAVYALKATVGFGSISLGSWRAWPRAHTENADPYAKAHRARAGKVLLGGAEGLAFSAEWDNEGNRLVTSCDYVVTGQTPPARFWTLHATDANDALLDIKEDYPAAFHSDHVQKTLTGEFEIHATGQPRSGNWLATGEQAKPFILVLTLFDTPTTGGSRLTDLQMPDIRRGACRDG